MTHHESTDGSAAPDPMPATDQPERSVAEDAWADVVLSLDKLGKAVTAWGSAVKDDPRNRERAEQLKRSFEGMGKEIGETVESAAKSDFARDLGRAAATTGGVLIDSARRFGDEVSPHLASAFKSAASGLREAAERLERNAEKAVDTMMPASEGRAGESAEQHPSPVITPHDDLEPPAPAPSGVHEEDD